MRRGLTANLACPPVVGAQSCRPQGRATAGRRPRRAVLPKQNDRVANRNPGLWPRCHNRLACDCQGSTNAVEER
jgi:hypothetical protein